MLIPYISSQFSEEINWTFMDFFIGGLALFGLGMLIQFLMTKLKDNHWRIPVIIAVVLIFILIWLELAVGILN